MAKKDFYTDGMTVEEILNLGDDQIRALSKRDISHALRTVSLAANKRINRLVNRAILTDEGYIEKEGTKKAIALDALNKLADESDGQLKFSTKGKTRNQMIGELKRAQGFMKMDTSTISGAENVGRNREIRTMKMTRADYVKNVVKDERTRIKKETGKAATTAQIKEVKVKAFKTFQSTNSEIWSRFRKWYETPGHSSYMKTIKGHEYLRYYGSDEILDMIANRTANGADEVEVLKAAAKIYDEKYIAAQEEIQKEQTMAEQAAKQPEDDFDFGENF